MSIEKPSPFRILLVEDEPHTAKAYRRGLSKADCDIDVAASFVEAKSALSDRAYDGVVLDLQLPDGSGERLIEHIDSLRPTPRIVVVSGTIDSQIALTLIRKGVIGLPKPATSESIVSALKSRRPRRITEAVEDFSAQYHLAAGELRVLRLGCNGLSASQIAESIQVSKRAVLSTWQRIFAKTGHRNQSQVIAAILRDTLQRPKEDC